MCLSAGSRLYARFGREMGFVRIEGVSIAILPWLLLRIVRKSQGELSLIYPGKDLCSH